VLPRTIAAASEGTRTELSYFRYPDDYGRRLPRLEVVRHGLRFAETIPAYPRDHFGARDELSWPTQRSVRRPRGVPSSFDPDGDSEPEVTVTLFWGGTRLCVWSRVYGFDRVPRRYEPVNHFWDNRDRPVLRYLDGDRSPEFVSGDGRFEEIGSSDDYVDPLQTWSYRHGFLRRHDDVLPTLIRRDARVLWLGYAGAAGGLAPRTYLAAWAGAAHRARGTSRSGRSDRARVARTAHRSSEEHRRPIAAAPGLSAEGVPRSAWPLTVSRWYVVLGSPRLTTRMPARASERTFRPRTLRCR